MHWIQVSQSHVLQRVLKGVQCCRDRQFPPIAAEYRPVYLLEQYCGGGLGRKAPRDIVEGESCGDGKLDDLIEENSRAREVSVVSRGLHDATVMHDLREYTSLAREQACTTPLPVALDPGDEGAQRTRIRAEFWKVNCSSVGQHLLFNRHGAFGGSCSL